jgi:hypothetical protein
MLSQIIALLGLLIALASIVFTAIQGAQVAVIGSAFILLAIFLELRKRT